MKIYLSKDLIIDNSHNVSYDFIDIVMLIRDSEGDVIEEMEDTVHLDDLYAAVVALKLQRDASESNSNSRTNCKCSSCVQCSGADSAIG